MLPMTPPVDFGFMVWGSAYVVFKWTVGLWTIRRLKIGLMDRSALRTEPMTIGRRSQNLNV